MRGPFSKNARFTKQNIAKKILFFCYLTSKSDWPNFTNAFLVKPEIDRALSEQLDSKNPSLFRKRYDFMRFSDDVQVGSRS